MGGAVDTIERSQATRTRDGGSIGDVGGRCGFTVWLTGLSGAGKSTIADALAPICRARGLCTEVLDGDEMRRTISPELGFSRVDRNMNVHRLGVIADLLSRNGTAVIVAAIAPYREARERVRRAHSAPYVEVFVECPLDELRRRDTKGLYARAQKGTLADLTGVCDPYEIPTEPEVHVRSDQQALVATIGSIVAYLERRRLLPARAARLPVVTWRVHPHHEAAR
jgi:adenylylsulfate kinase